MVATSYNFCNIFNPFMRNVVKWPNILWKSCGVHTARFLKCVWPFYNMHERVKGLKKYIRVETSWVNFVEHIIVNLFRYWKYTYIYHCSDLISQDLISQCRSSNEINVYQSISFRPVSYRIFPLLEKLSRHFFISFYSDLGCFIQQKHI